MDEKKFDVRTLERSLDQKQITREEYDAFLKSLPDVADLAAPMESKFEEGILDEKN
jgi:hypothetical protein